MDRVSGTPQATGLPEAAKQIALSVKEQFAQAGDYLAFATAIHGLAAKGNADAQYYLGEALRYCAGDYRVYYWTREGPGRTVEEAVARASAMKPALDPDEARLVYARCHALVESDTARFGIADDWREASAASGQPLAQIDLALDYFLQTKVYPNSQSTADPNPLLQAARELMSKAIKSKDPEAIWKAGDLQAALAESREGGGNRLQWVWRVAACQRGMDCSATSKWHRFWCRFDFQCPPGESGMDYILRNVPEGEYDSIVQDATELNANIDSGQWSKIGIGSARR